MRRPSPPAEGEAQTGPLILYSLLTGGLAGGAALLASLALKAVEARVGGLLGYLPPGPPGEGGLGQAFTGPSSPLLPLLLLPALFALSGWLASLPGAFPRARAYLAALVQLGAYSPLGREGLFGGLGLWVGEVLGKRFSRIGRVLAFAGLAAGLGASLHAPVAGALLATEMRYRGLRLEAQALAPALLGALAGFTVYGALLGYAPLVPVRAEASWGALPLGFGLGLGAALLGTLWLQGAGLLERGSSRLSLPLRHGLLGLALGLALLLAPEALGQGTGWLALATTPLLFPEAVLYLLLAKGLLLVLALGSRAPGGLLTPALVLGGLLGALVGKLPLPAALPGPEALALASGAALLAGVARAPFAALVLAAEWGGYALLPLVLPAVFVSYALTEAQSLGPEGQAAPPSETPPQTAPPPSGPEAASGPGSPRG
ncbi:hypothetical protein TthHB5008_09030 [Thermus thermophilus]|mgnify:FL=1|uniref:Hypothetical membrane spanning protein n=1 Tax=Thermus thermophilus (strain ATCC BAA-163 / DSM 7039 / HB27) TaxID=262724 RepID=Q72KD0_THET2|nr:MULTISPECIES: chloride channel protein [Thermus]AAS80864.1 hypothetical membrane spanning protein [Thermus thermophilus HB27]QMV30578.1 Voltage-gated ClC-type chloride channel ClcB [Thermus thermophilus]BBL93399.1 hypothetical protein TthHC11_09330 [Thermus thermophilus]BCP97802.1 hypothetical protein TthHB5002_09050 [Thermus thermophilus]BCQ00133.1 hypothetical protein TthHB5008_09030 [Thermus thermophilus]